MSIRISKFTTLFFTILVANALFAQFYNTGTDPARLKWREIRTPSFYIIYPSEADSLARRYALLLEKSAESINRPLYAEPRRIPVVLHPYNVYSNGVVAWAPRRMELFTTPPSFGGSTLNWEKQLVLHESRHLAQMTKFERGFYKPLSLLIGEQSVIVGTALYMRTWALEGDAVVAETENSRGGRGRSPSHLLYYKSAFLNGHFRNIYRWTLGSYKRHTPNEYSFGYMLYSAMRFNSANYFLTGDIMTSLVDNFYTPVVVNKSYKKGSGHTISENFEIAKEILVNQWSREDSLRRPFTSYRTITGDENDYHSYLSSQISRRDVIYAVKTDLDYPPRIVRVTPEGEENLVFIGSINGEPVLHKEKLYWSEKRPSLRWEHESYAEIVELDTESLKKRRVTKETRFMNPKFSNSGEIVAVAEYNQTGGSSLVLLNSNDFSVTKRVASPESGQIVESIVIGDKIYSTVITDKGMALFSIDTVSYRWLKEIEEQYHTMESLSEYKGTILFSSDLNGADNIYNYDTRLKFLRRLTSAPLAAKSPNYCSSRESLIYSNYTHNGYKLVETPMDSLKWEPASFDYPFKNALAEELSLQSGFNIDTVKLAGADYLESKPYSKFKHLFRLHSWTPLYINTDILNNISYENVYNVVSPGVSVYSQNSLGTADGMLGYAYYNGFHSGHLRFSYRALYPIFEFRADLNDRYKEQITLTAGDIYNPEMVTTPVEGSSFFNFSMLTYVPFNLSEGGWLRGMIPKLHWKFSNDSYYSLSSARFTPYHHITLGLQYYQVQRRALRSIFPKWGFGVGVQYNVMPFAGENFGSTFYLNSYSYMPGLFKNQGIRLAVAYQRQLYEGKRYLMKNLAASPRGYDAHFSINYVSIFTDYAIPVYLGDISLSWLLYLKRAQIIPFFDWAYSKGMTKSRHLWSAGADLLIDFNALNISVPLTAGLRYIRTRESKDIFQFIFTTPLI